VAAILLIFINARPPWARGLMRGPRSPPPEAGVTAVDWTTLACVSRIFTDKIRSQRQQQEQQHHRCHCSCPPCLRACFVSRKVTRDSSIYTMVSAFIGWISHAIRLMHAAANKCNSLPCFVNISTTIWIFYKKICAAISHSYLSIIAKLCYISVSDTRKFDRGLSALLHDELPWLDRHARKNYLQAGRHGVSLSARSSTSVPRWPSHSSLWCRFPAAGSVSVLRTDNNFSYPAAVLTRTAVGLSRLLVRLSGTRYLKNSKIRRVVLTALNSSSRQWCSVYY